MSEFIVYALKDANGVYYFVGKSQTGLRRPRQLKTGPCSKALRKAIDAANHFEIEVLVELPTAEGLSEALQATQKTLTGFGYQLVPSFSPSATLEALHAGARDHGDAQRAKVLDLVRANPKATNAELASKMGLLGKRAIGLYLRQLHDLGLIESRRSKSGRTLRVLE